MNWMNDLYHNYAFKPRTINALHEDVLWFTNHPVTCGEKLQYKLWRISYLLKEWRLQTWKNVRILIYVCENLWSAWMPKADPPPPPLCPQCPPDKKTGKIRLILKNRNSDRMQAVSGIGGGAHKGQLGRKKPGIPFLRRPIGKRKWW